MKGLITSPIRVFLLAGFLAGAITSVFIFWPLLWFAKLPSPRFGETEALVFSTATWMIFLLVTVRLALHFANRLTEDALRIQWWRWLLTLLALLTFSVAQGISGFWWEDEGAPAFVVLLLGGWELIPLFVAFFFPEALSRGLSFLPFPLQIRIGSFLWMLVTVTLTGWALISKTRRQKTKIAAAGGFEGSSAGSSTIN